MNLIRNRFFFLLPAILLHSAIGSANLLPLQGYLEAVKAGNSEFKGNQEKAEAGQLRSEEGHLLLAPTLIANAQFGRDAKLPPTLLLLFDSQNTQTYSLGVSQLTTFGLQAKLHYDLYYSDYSNPKPLVQIPGVGSFVPTSYALASPVLELTQSLWSNGFGRSTQATQEQIEAGALASSYLATFQSKSTLVQAESAYWRLAIARQTVAVEQEAFDRAQKIYNWNAEKARLHLRENSDVLQAQASAKSRELDLLSAQNEERSASRTFNTLRGISSDEVKETLEEMAADKIAKLEAPKRAAFRDDVKAAQQSTRSAVAGTTVSEEKALPTLEAFATLSMNGQTNTISTSISDTISKSWTNRSSQMVGLRLVMPLTNARSKTLEGWQKERIAAEKILDQKLFDQEQSWRDLNDSLADQRKQLALSLALEEVQKSKLDNERNRYKAGRTTTYQVLLFEQDYLYAQLATLRNKLAVLGTLTQMKLFGETL